MPLPGHPQTEPVEDGPAATAADDEDERLICSAEATAELVTPGVVRVTTPSGSGSAFYVGESEFVTAAHVVDGTPAVTAAPGSTRYDGEVAIAREVPQDLDPTTGATTCRQLARRCRRWSGARCATPSPPAAPATAR